MAGRYRAHPLEKKELLALYSGEQQQDYELEFDEDSRCRSAMPNSFSLGLYGFQRQASVRQVYFSNQEYYLRLEELKKAHLRNMAELERLYIGQGEADNQRQQNETIRVTGINDRISLEEKEAGSTYHRRLQRINSQEELDLHETSSGSDQSELLYKEENQGEIEQDLDHTAGTAGMHRTTGRKVPLIQYGNKTLFGVPPKASVPKPTPNGSHPAGVKLRSKVTVPKPFQMMIREEERKRHRVRTRSEIELENTLLKQELKELQECQKQFQASPAPAHIYLPLYEAISQRFGQRCGATSFRCKGNHGGSGNSGNWTSSSFSQRPFAFLERERKKKEQRIMAELANLAPKVEHQPFRARPLPSSVYGTRKTEESGHHRPRSLTFSSVES